MDWEEQSEQILKVNKSLLREFRENLVHNGLSPKTVNAHVSNVDLYLNSFLSSYESVNAHEGANRVDGFLGDWFIRKAVWSSKNSIKSTAGSLKKFYKFMLQQDLIKEQDYENLTKTIKDYMPQWLETMDNYDNYDEEDWEF